MSSLVFHLYPVNNYEINRIKFAIHQQNKDNSGETVKKNGGALLFWVYICNLQIFSVWPENSFFSLSLKGIFLCRYSLKVRQFNNIYGTGKQDTVKIKLTFKDIRVLKSTYVFASE